MQGILLGPEDLTGTKLSSRKVNKYSQTFSFLRQVSPDVISAERDETHLRKIDSDCLKQWTAAKIIARRGREIGGEMFCDREFLIS